MQLRRLFFPLVLVCLALLMDGCLLNRSTNSHWSRIEWLNVPASDSNLIYPKSTDYYESVYTGNDGVYLEKNYFTEHIGDLVNWKYYEVSKLRYIVLNPEVESLTTLRLGVDNDDQTLDSVYMTITSPDGETRHFGLKDMIEEQKSEEETVYKFVYPDVKKGSMIEEGFIRRTDDNTRPMIRQHFFRLQTSLPTEKVVYRYTCPLSWSLTKKRTGMEFHTGDISSDTTRAKLKAGIRSAEDGDFSTGIISEQGLKDSKTNAQTLQITGRDVPAWADDESWSPYAMEIIPYVRFMVSSATAGRYILEKQKTFGEMLSGLRLDEDEIADMRRDEDLQDLAQELSEGAQTTLAKADAINSWVQDNLEIGECGRRNCDYEDVLESGKGSFFTILEITIALLNHAGFDSRMILIHPASAGNFDTFYKSAIEFIPPGVVAIQDSDTLVMFPQIGNLPAGLLPSTWQERPALYIGIGDRVQFKRSPESAMHENTQEEEYELTIDEDGLIKVREVKYFRGLSAFGMRTALEDIKASEMDDFMSELLTYDEGDVKLKDYQIENREDRHAPLKITLNYSIDNLVTVTPDEVIFQTGGLFSPSSERKHKVETDERQNPIRIYADELLIKRISINFPPEWTMDTKLKSVDFSNHFGELEAKYADESGRFVVDQRRLLKKSNEPKERYEELLQITGRQSQLQVPTLVFTVKDM